MKTLTTVKTAVFAAIFCFVAATKHDTSSIFNPSEGSPTADWRCGVTDEQLTAEGYKYKVTFKGGEVLAASVTFWVFF